MPQKPLSKDIVWASKQFRILSEMGFKKEEIETALRNSNMNIEDALELLNMSGNWSRGRHVELEPAFDHSNPPGAFPSQRFNPQQLPFAPPGSSGNGPNSGSQLGNMTENQKIMAIVQKIMTQQPPPTQTPSQPPTPFTQTARPQQANQPSAHQLRMLVQQIQMALQAGYLNHQILNQPLAPQTLILLNQLLQHIKVLQNLMQQQQMMQLQNPLSKPNSNQAMLHNAVQITKTKQLISNLQNQIQAQQAIYVKQHGAMPPQPGAGGGDFLRGTVGGHDPLSALPTAFSDLSINKEPQHSSAFAIQQSRLTQWKLSLYKDGDLAGLEFSRAPGSTAKPATGNSSPNLNPLLGQTDGTWSRSNSEGGWPDSGSVADDSKEWPNSTQATNQAFTDLVPEFEPGKPWKVDVDLISLRESLEEVAECPICLELLKPPVSLCVNGHGTCGECKGTLTQCPTCRKPYCNIEPRVLNEILQKIPKVCKYYDAGCREPAKDDHELYCGFRKVKCILHDKDGSYCDWEGPAHKFQGHVCVNEHLESCSPDIVGPNAFKFRKFKDPYPEKSIYDPGSPGQLFVFTHVKINGYFCLYIELFPLGKPKVTTYLTLIFLNSAGKVEYQYKVKAMAKTTLERDVSVDNNVFCMRLPVEELEKLVDKAGDLCVNCEITSEPLQ